MRTNSGSRVQEEACPVDGRYGTFPRTREEPVAEGRVGKIQTGFLAQFC